MYKVIIFSILIGLILSISAFSMPIDELQKIIDRKGANWTAKETELSSLSWKEKRQLLGCGSEPAPPVGATPIHLPQRDFPEYWNWWYTGWMNEVQDQGSCGACYSFAACGQLEAVIKITHDDANLPIDLSEQFIVSCSGQGGCTEGGNITLTNDFLRDTGVVDENCFPYEASDVPCGNACDDWENHLYHTDYWDYVTMGNANIENIKNALMEQPLYTRFGVYDDFFDYDGLDTTEVYQHVAGEYVYGHAVVIVGWDDSQECWIVRNSWGSGWGDNGHFRIAWESGCGFGEYSTMASYNPVIPPPPQNFALDVSGDVNVQLNWDLPDTTESGLTLVGYNIFRRMSGNPTSNLIATIDIPDSTSFLDEFLPNGVWYYKVSAVYQQEESYATIELSATIYDPLTPKVLLVDDDGSTAYQGYSDVQFYFTSALIANNIGYTLWETGADEDDVGPPIDTLNLYETVIWFTGEKFTDNETLTSQDENNLEDYLDAGGKLFLSSMDYLVDRHEDGNIEPGDFAYDYLHVTGVDLDVNLLAYPETGTVIGQSGSAAQGMSFPIMDIFSINQRDGLWIDQIDHDGVDFFEITSPSPAGIVANQWGNLSSPYQTIFTTVPFPALVDGSHTKADLMLSILQFFGIEPPPDEFDISGNVNYYSQMNPIPDVSLILSYDGPNEEITTNFDGSYIFDDKESGNYTVRPSMVDEHEEAIRAYDAALVTQYLQGMIELDENQIIASDVTHNDVVSFFDAFFIGQHIIGQMDTFPSGNWRFLPDIKIYSPLDEDKFDENYIGILRGDVSGNWGTEAPPPQETVLVSMPDTSSGIGDSISIPIFVEGVAQTDIISYEFIVNFDPTVLRFINVSNDSTCASDFYLASKIDTALVTAIGYGAQSLSADGCLINLNFDVVGSVGDSTQLTISDFIFNEGNPGAAFDSIAATFVVTETGVFDNNFSDPQYSNKLYPNYPNPFNPSTTIAFTIPQDGAHLQGGLHLRLNIYDISGKLIKKLVDGEMESGYHSVVWNGKNDNGKDVASGVYFYRIGAGSYTETKSMLLLK